MKNLLGPLLLPVLLLFAVFCQAAGPILPPREEIAVISPAYARYLEVRKETRRLLDAKDYAGLDELARELRKSRESFQNGTWLLTSFYETAVSIPRKNPLEAAEAMKFYQAWAADKPESITAQLCLADAYTDYAWAARGSGWGNTVTDEGWRLMAERLDEAWKILQTADLLAEKCPQWFAVAQTVALGQGWERDRYFQMMDKAIRQEPSYGTYYRQACYWLLPRWHGEAGDFENWIGEQADAHPEKDKHYARLVWQADALDDPEEMIFAPGRLDWARVERGFAIWLQEMPGNLPVRFEFLHLALLANDRETARAQFEVTGGKYWPQNWQRKPELFEQARRFAYADGKNPLLTTPPKTAPRPLLTPSVVQRIQTWARLIGGTLAGVGCLVLGLQRKRLWPAFALLVICPVLAALYGTLACALPALVFLAYLWSREPADLPEAAPHRWGVTLLWVLAIFAFDLALQIVTTVLALLPGMVAGGFQAAEVQAASNRLFASGEGFKLVLNAEWLSLFALFIVCERQSWTGWKNRLALHPVTWGKALGCIAAGGAIIYGLGLLVERLGDDRTKASLELIAQGLHSPVIFLVAVVGLAPIFEELLLRGYAFQSWLPRFGFYGTAAFSSLIFSLSHIQYGWAGLLHIFILGCVLAWVRWKTGSVWPCIALHMANNLAGVLLLLLDPARPT